MAGQQITWAEIEAYDAAMLTGRPAWAKRLIRRLDDAFEASRPENAASRPGKTNVADMRASLRASIAARKAAAKAKGEPS